MQRDLTKGNLLKNIVVFSLPFLLSYFLQTLYGMADLFIVGQFDGANVISGVAIGSQVMHMITVMLVGVATGGAVMIGRYVGAHDKENVSKTIGNTITLFVIIAAILTALLLLLVSPIVTIMSTPKEAIVETSNYLKICFIGIPFIIAYNVISSIFRGMGDSKSPMYFIAVACVVNIALDYYFIGTLSMHASGAALATIIAQAFSVIVAIITIATKQLIQLSFSSLKFEKETITSILKIGIPVSLQDGFIQVAFLIITIIANSRGVEISAAVGIVEKIISFLFLVPSTMMQTVSTISSQAIGAGKKALARKTLFTSMAISTSIGLIFAISFQFISEPVIALFTHDAQVVQLATGYMHSYVFDCAIASMHFCFSGFFVASGYSIVSFIHNVASIITLRVPGAYLASIYYPKTLFPMGLAAPAGGVLQLAICIGFYRYLRKKNKI
ncbi:MATE family efflux transporter [Sharpea azabuensis]|uniref:MATE family efflux transporter n=1 Tax=Sharpea azabuensis TaxID=322505 RepID=UPI0015631710|nr:MATE family efflux transporter [Sharpea azabuensis]